jgi:hypothetical protein
MQPEEEVETAEKKTDAPTAEEVGESEAVDGK